MPFEPLIGYQPNSTAVQTRSIDIWRVKNGKLIEHLLDVFMRRHGPTPARPHSQYLELRHGDHT